MKNIRRVLVVDDSLVQRRIISAMLSNWGVEILEADNGAEALALCQSAQPDVILSDWMMPGMSGLEFCRAFREISKESYAYFILLTSKNEKSEVALGLDAGADDFMTKPVNQNELRARINAGARILTMERELSTKNRLINEKMSELLALYDALDQDLQQARRIQQALVPRRQLTMENGRISLLLRPCGHVGGDLVGMFQADRIRAAFYNIDVSGHGITSALVSARVASYLSSDFPDTNLALERRFSFHALKNPEDVALELNKRLSTDPSASEYLTMLFVTADMTSGRVRFVQAGHPPPLLIAADGRHRFISNSGMPVGLLPDATFEGHDVLMQPGDKLLLYSDGFTESEMPDGRFLEEEGLLELVKQITTQNGIEFLDDLYWNLCEVRSRNSDHTDDISAVLYEFKPDALP
ncbi:MAG: PP2C family protein-serine/threonine phosphatase [Primorskyibacter sp.]